VPGVAFGAQGQDPAPTAPLASPWGFPSAAGQQAPRLARLPSGPHTNTLFSLFYYLTRHVLRRLKPSAATSHSALGSPFPHPGVTQPPADLAADPRITRARTSPCARSPKAPLAPPGPALRGSVALTLQPPRSHHTSFFLLPQCFYKPGLSGPQTTPSAGLPTKAEAEAARPSRARREGSSSSPKTSGARREPPAAVRPGSAPQSKHPAHSSSLPFSKTNHPSSEGSEPLCARRL